MSSVRPRIGRSALPTRPKRNDMGGILRMPDGSIPVDINTSRALLAAMTSPAGAHRKVVAALKKAGRERRYGTWLLLSCTRRGLFKPCWHGVLVHERLPLRYGFVVRRETGARRGYMKLVTQDTSDFLGPTDQPKKSSVLTRSGKLAVAALHRRLDRGVPAAWFRTLPGLPAVLDSTQVAELIERGQHARAIRVLLRARTDVTHGPWILLASAVTGTPEFIAVHRDVPVMVRVTETSSEKTEVDAERAACWVNRQYGPAEIPGAAIAPATKRAAVTFTVREWKTPRRLADSRPIKSAVRALKKLLGTTGAPPGWLYQPSTKPHYRGSSTG